MALTIIPAFCSNLLPQESLDDLLPALLTFAKGVRQQSEVPLLGIDLRLGLQAITQANQRSDLADWRQRFQEAGLVITTLNAFPLLPFQSDVVKDQAYRPDWGSTDRLKASISAIAIADQLSHEADEICTISTLPGSYRPWAEAEADPLTMARHLGQWVVAAWHHRQRGGRRVVLAIEPEPCCSWGSGAELAQFWQTYGQHTLSQVCQDLHSTIDGQTAINEHLACCWDTCHASVVFEDQAGAIAALSHLGLAPLKVQYSAAPGAAPPLSAAGIAALVALDEPRFCHQVGIRDQASHITVLPDLSHLAAWHARLSAAEQQSLAAIRTHFHIPIHRDPDSPELASTIADSRLGLAAALRHGARHVSVETYTWSLRAAHGEDPIAGTAAEIRHLQQTLNDLGEDTKQ